MTTLDDLAAKLGDLFPLVRRLDDRLDGVDRRLIELRDRVGGVERGQADLSVRMAHVETSVAHLGVRFDHMEDRLHRVEKRLGLVD